MRNRIMGLVYKATSKTTGKVYCGYTMQSLERRAYWHKIESRDMKNTCHFYCAIRKYGFDDFVWDIIVGSDSIDFLLLSEKYYVENHNLIKEGYNSRPGGWGSKPTEETRKKMSEAKIGTTHSKETRQKISLANIGKHEMSEENREKLLNVLIGNKHFLGKKHTEETKKQIREKLKGHSFSEETRRKIGEACSRKQTKVLCVETNIVYNSVKLASDSVGGTKQGIRCAINGVFKTYKGFHWSKHENTRTI
jgi:group I intron endonuclease